MEASGSGAAAAARVKAGAPPRLVAVQGTAGNGALAEQRTARLVVFLGIADDASSRVAAALLEDWCIDDPRGKDADTVRFIRDAIDRRAQRLLIRLGVAVPARRAR